jgi:YD repeat-containing protein
MNTIDNKDLPATNPTWFTIGKHLVVLVAVILVTVSCKNDNGDPVPKSSAKQITGFQFLASSNEVLSENIIAVIDESAKTITAPVPYGTDITALIADVAISEAATITPTLAQNFTNAVTYTVTAEDGSSASYTVNIVVRPALLTSVQIESVEFLYSYNTDNQLTAYESLISGAKVNIDVVKNRDGSLASMGAGTYTYNSSGQPVTINDGSGNGSTILEYDGARKLVRQQTLNRIITTGTYSETKDFGYDAATRLSQVDIRTSHPGSLYYRRIIMSYSAQGNIAQLIVQRSSNGTTYTLEETVNYVYDDKINPLKKITEEQLGLSDFYVAAIYPALTFSTILFAQASHYSLCWISNNNVLSKQRIYAGDTGTSTEVNTYTYNEFDLPTNIETNGTNIFGGTLATIYTTLNYNF